ncbi:MAG: Minf_1886 family protein [Verrucomicrobiota bacterium]
MAKPTFSEVVTDICARDDRFDAEAYTFIREGLDHTLKNLKRKGQGANRHVSGQELLHGLKDYALYEYGPMAKMVLNSWGVTRCEHFGDIVFNLVGGGVLGKTDTDRPEDFKNGFTFDEAFVAPYEARRDTPLAEKIICMTRGQSPRKRRSRKNSTPELS